MSQKKFLDYTGLQNFLNKLKGLIPTKTSELQNDSGFITSEGTYDSALSLDSERAVQNKVVTAAINGKQDTLSTAQTNAVDSGITSSKVQGYDSHISDTDIHVTQADKTNWDSKASGTHTHLASEVSGLSTVATSGSYSDLTNKPTIDSALSSTSTNAVQNKVINTELGKKANKTDLATVATSGSYNDLSNKPSIPSKTSDLTNDSGFLTFHNPVDSALSSTSTNAVQNKVINTELGKKANTTDLATVATSGSYNDLTNKPTIPTVNNATLTIQKNGSTVKTFTANASSNVTANITVPTKVSELTNDSGYLTSASNLDSSKLTGTIDIARLPKGALERLVTVANQTARFALTTSDVQLGDTVKQLDTGVMYIVTDESKLSSADGYTEYTAGAATSVPWSGVTGKPSSYTPASHSHGNIANGGTLGTASRALITDGDKKITTSSVTSTELGYVSGVTSAIQTQLNGKAASSHTHTVSEVSGLSTVATSGSYNDLSDKPTIPTVNNATLTIQKNGTTVKTFTANASSNVTANITVPTKTSELTNDSGYLTSHQDISGLSAKADTIKALSISGRTITYTKGDDTTGTLTTQDNNTWTAMVGATSSANGSVGYVNAVPPKDGYNTKYLRADGTWAVPPDHTYTVNNKTLTIQKNGTSVATFTANSASDVTANITVPTKTSELTNDSHQTITVGTDTTSTASPAHSGTFTCIDSVTRDSNGHVTAVNTKTVTLPSDNNTDTLVTQNVSTANENHPVLLTVTKDATANQGAKTSIFASGVKVNPSTNTVTATTFSGALSGNAATATQFSANKSVTLTGDVTGTASSKAGWSVATTLSDSGVTAGTYGPSADVTGNNNATISVPEITVDAKGRVTSVTNRTLTCKNNTYSVYNKTLTIQKNGTNVATFTSNSNTDVTANITVPTKVSELTNDSGYLTSHQSLSNYVTLNGTQTISGAKTFSGLTKTAGKTEQGSPSDLNDALYNVETYSWGGSTTNKPASSYGILLNLNREGNVHSSTSNGWRAQLGIGTDARLYLRTKANTGGEWSAWKEFLTSHQSLSNYSTLANTVKSLSISGKTITVTPGSGSAYTLTTQDTTYSNFVKSGSGAKAGLVPAPSTTAGTTKYLREDGTWQVPPDHTYTVNNATLTIQKNGTNVATFTSNASSNATANITVPTKTSELTNDSGYLTSHQSLSNYVTLNGTQTISGAKTLSADTLTGLAGNGYRIINGSSKVSTGYGVFQRIDSGTWYLMVTAKDDALGTWTTARPAQMALSTGVLNINGNAATATKLATARTINGVSFDGSANITVADSTKVAKTGDTMTGQFIINRANTSAGGGLKLTGDGQNFAISICDTAITKGTAPSAQRYCGIEYYGDDNSNYNKRLGMVEFGLSQTNLCSANLRAYNCTTATNTATCTISCNVDSSGNVYTGAPTPATSDNSTKIATTAFVKAQGYITASSNITGTSANVTGTVAIANGGTGATTRLNAVKALTNESVGTSAQYFLTITSSWGKAGYTSVADAKTVLGLGSAAYTASTAYAAASHTHSDYSTLANTVKSLSISGKTITVTPGSGSAYTLTTQDTVYTHPTTSGNKHIPSGGSSGQFLGWDSDGTAKWVNNPNTNTDTLMTQNVSTTNATYPVLLVATADATTNQGAKTGIFAKSVKVNPSTNVISASGFSGPLTGDVTGNVTGNCSGSSGSCTGNAATATQFSANKSVALTGDVTGSASSKAGWSVATTLANSGVTAGSYGPSAAASPAHGGTFSVPYITVDAKGRVTAASSQTITLPADSNTDTKVTQTVTTGNSYYPVILGHTANQTETETSGARFSKGFLVNTRYSFLYIRNTYNSENTKGVRNTSTYTNALQIFQCYDGTEMGRLYCESNKDGYTRVSLRATNYIKDGAIATDGTATHNTLSLDVKDDGSKLITIDGNWNSNLTPATNNSKTLGTSSLKWKAAYAVNFYENGTALSSLYQSLSDAKSVEIKVGETLLAGIRSDKVTSTNVSTGAKLQYQTSIINASALTVFEFVVGSGTSGLYLMVSETSNIPSSAGTYVWLGKNYTSIVAGSNQYYVGMVKRISI